MMQTYLDQRQISKQRRSFRIKIYFGFLFLALSGIFIFYLIIYSPVFKIREFKISGNSRISEKEVLNILSASMLDNRIKNFLGLNNLLSWNKNHLTVFGSGLAGADIGRDWLRQSVSINVKERERLAVWCGINNFCYWIDPQGLPFEEAPATEGSLILTVSDNNPDGTILYKNIIEERFVKNLAAILRGILELRIPAKKIVFDKKMQELNVESYSGPDIYFSIRFDPKLNLASLQSVETKVGVKNIKYIDLRVENRIYYK